MSSNESIISLFSKRLPKPTKEELKRIRAQQRCRIYKQIQQQELEDIRQQREEEARKRELEDEEERIRYIGPNSPCKQGIHAWKDRDNPWDLWCCKYCLEEEDD